MKKCLISVLFFICVSTILYAQKDGDNMLWGVPKLSVGLNSTDTLPVLAGRGIAFIPGPNSLDGDDLADIIVSDWYGRVFVFEQVSKASLDFKMIWASPKLKAKANGTISTSLQGTPRTVTFSDLDGNGKKEILVPLGYAPGDSINSDTTYQRGIHVYECLGDNNYGTKPFIIRPESFDPNTKNYAWGRMESPGLIAADVDGDGKQELLAGSTTLSFNSDLTKAPSKAYILSVKSGTFAQKNANVAAEYIYTKMAKALKNDSDGYTPNGFTLADVDGDSKDEIIVTGRTIIGTGGAIGFIKATGPDQYIDGSILDLTASSKLNIFRVTAQLAKIKYQNRDVVFIKTDELSSDNRVMVLADIIDISLAGDNNISIIKKGKFGGFTGGALADQDHGTASDGFDFFFPYGDNNGGFGIYDMEYKGTGNIADSASYNTYNIFDVHKILRRGDPGLYQIFAPGTDLNNNGKKELITNFQFWEAGDTLVKSGITLKAPIAFFVLEWGDTTMGTVSVKPLNLISPADYTLEQNYPNPFNPTTTIKFTLPASENLDMIIYDMNGREVRKLIDNQNYAAGTYQIVWDGKNTFGKQAASGMYIYKMKWGNFEKSMKMSFIK